MAVMLPIKVLQGEYFVLSYQVPDDILTIEGAKALFVCREEGNVDGDLLFQLDESGGGVVVDEVNRQVVFSAPADVVDEWFLLGVPRGYYSARIVFDEDNPEASMRLLSYGKVKFVPTTGDSDDFDSI